MALRWFAVAHFAESTLPCQHGKFVNNCKQDLIHCGQCDGRGYTTLTLVLRDLWSCAVPELVIVLCVACCTSTCLTSPSEAKAAPR